VLDDITPLRQATAVGGAHGYLYAPETAVRVDNDTFVGTPLPPEEPQADNPPNGAILDYYLSGPATKVALQILDAQGHVIRHYSSAEKHPAVRPLLPIAERWFPKPPTLETSAGEHRFVWDLHAGSSSAGLGDEDPDNAAGAPAGPRIPPGRYTVRLEVDGTTTEHPLQVAMDPRSSATQQVLEAQYSQAEKIYTELLAGRKAMAELESVERQIQALHAGEPSTPAELATAVRQAQSKLDAIRGGSRTVNAEHGEDQPGLAEAVAGLGADLRVVESGDRTAPAVAQTLFDQMSAAEREKVAAWELFRKTDLPTLNNALQAAHREPIRIAWIEEQVHYAMTR
jgi:hypothetical protein